MADIGKTVVKMISGREVICRELTVGQVRALIAKDCKQDLANVGLMGDMMLEDVEVFTNLSPEEVDAMHPSVLADVVAGCKEANPHFFGMLDRLNTPRKTA